MKHRLVVLLAILGSFLTIHEFEPVVGYDSFYAETLPDARFLLKEAILKGDEERVKELLDEGVDPNCCLDSLRFPFEYAMRCNAKYTILKMLIDKGVDVNNALFAVAHCRDELRAEKVTSFLLENGANVNNQNVLGRTALFIAASKGNWPLARLLLNEKANPSITNRDGKKAIDVVSLLSNPDPNDLRIKNALLNAEEGITPRMVEMQQFLLESLNRDSRVSRLPKDIINTICDLL